MRIRLLITEILLLVTEILLPVMRKRLRARE